MSFILSVLTVALTFNLSAQAEENTITTLDQAFQREYVYLTSQREALRRQKETIDKNMSARVTRLKAEVERLQTEWTRLSVSNEELQDNLNNLEKKRREITKNNGSVQSIYRKASKTLNAVEKAMRFEVTDNDDLDLSPESKNLENLTDIFRRSAELLNASSQRDEFHGAYLDQQSQLASAKITRLGRVAAFIDKADQRHLLAPNGQGILKVLETTNKTSAYFFENLREASVLKKPATWVERLADFGPLIFLSMMLLLVAGLFAVMVKI